MSQKRMRLPPREQLGNLVGEPVYSASQVINMIEHFSMIHATERVVRVRIRKFILNNGINIDEYKIKYHNGRRSPSAAQYYLPKSKLYDLISNFKIPVSVNQLMEVGPEFG